MSLLTAVYNKLERVQECCDNIQERVFSIEEKIKKLEVDIECAPGGEVESSIKDSYIVDAWKNDT